MNIIHSEYRDRIAHWIRTLKRDFYMPLGELNFGFCPTMGRIPLKDADKLDFRAVSPGFTWGNTYEYGWFCSAFILPEEARGERIVLNLEPGGEAALFLNGREFGTYRAGWVKEHHHFLEDNFITDCAVPGTEYTLYMEVYAGHYIPEAESGHCATGPVLPGAYEDPLKPGKRRQLGVSTYGIWNEAAYQLYMDVMTLQSLLNILDQDSLRAQKVAEALEEFTLCVDFEQSRDRRIKDYQKAREILAPVLDAENGATMPLFSCVGNSHLDLAWLWTKEETIRKTARTFGAQLRLLEEYPDYYYIQSQPASYELCRENYPQLFERIKQAVKEGRWIAEGAMWVEPDTNMAGGEALIRQLLYGKKYYREMFGIDSRLLWLPDTFGYSAVLPQILKGCGVDYLVTQKIFWSYNEGDPFPYHYFYWEGMDGTKVTSFLPTSYTYKTDPEELNLVWKNRVQRRNIDSFLIPFGYGDGGGGPSRDYIEYLRRQKNLEGGVQVKMENPLDYFKRMDEKGGPSNTYTGELYFTAHRGTYTSQAAVKKWNRRAEFTLRRLELWSVAAAVLERKPYPAEKIEELWKRLLFNQFHDILPGSSMGKVYEEAEQELSQLCCEAEHIIFAAIQSMVNQKEGLTVWNSLPFERYCMIQLPKNFGNTDMDSCVDGKGRKYKIFCEGDVRRVRVLLPALGTTVLYPCQSAELSEQEQQPYQAYVYKSGDGYIMQNGILRVQIGSNGEIFSFGLSGKEKNIASGPMNHFRMFKDVPRKFDAWDIDSNYERQETEGIFDIHTEIVSEGGSRAAVQVSAKVGESSILQNIILEAGSDRLDFETTVEWKELHRLLKVSFPTVIQTENGINEIQFGYIERPMHRSRIYEKDRFEVCNHRYSAVCDGGNGFGILNDCKYGISMKDGTLELTLLRAGACPDMRADNGLHRFTYGITAWKGSFEECRIAEQGYEINEPPLIFEGTAPEISLAMTECRHIMIDTVKMAEDGSGDLIFRMYETKKWRDTIRLRFGFPVKYVWNCDMLENKIEKLLVEGQEVQLDFRAFEIKTLRVQLKNE